MKEGSYFVAEESLASVDELRRDPKKREAMMKDVKIKIVQVENVREDNILPLQAFKIAVSYKGKEIVRVSRSVGPRFTRYQDFAWLEEILAYEYFGRVIPMNPPKSMLTKIGISNEKFMKERTEGVERFARRVICMDGINSCDHIFNFLLYEPKGFAAVPGTDEGDCGPSDLG
jgi:hypothetical protein